MTSFRSIFYSITLLQRALLCIGVGGVIVGISGVFISKDPSWIIFFDNLHWTCAYATGALFAWTGIRLAYEKDQYTVPWWWFFIGLTSYTIAQIIWAIQVYIGWTPFPGISDPFFLMLGLSLIVGLATYGRSRFDKEQWRIVKLDSTLLVIAMLVVTMTLYLPRQGSYSFFQLSVMTAYPTLFGAAASLAVMILLTMRARLNLSVLILVLAIVTDMVLWNQWNLRMLANALINGSVLNILFSPTAILLGIGIAIWEPEANPDKNWERICERILRMLPIFIVVLAATGIILTYVLPGMGMINRTTADLGGMVVLILATIRQNITLKDLERLIETQKKMERDIKLSQFSLDHAQDAIYRLSKEGKFLYINDAGCSQLGYTREELLSFSIEDIDPQVAETGWNNIWKQVSNTGWRRFETFHKKKDGTIIPVEVVSNHIEYDGEYSFASVRDISERKRSERVLRALAETDSQESEDIFKTIISELAQSYNMRYALIGRIHPDIKDRIDTLVVWADGKCIENFSDFLPGTPCQTVVENDFCFYPDEVDVQFSTHRLLKDMKIKSYIGISLKNKHEQVLGVMAIMDDRPMVAIPQTQSLLKSLAVRASIELERRESEEKQELSSRIFNETHEGIMITRADGTIIDVNPTFSEITGYSREEVIDQTPRILNSGRQAPGFYTDMWCSLVESGHWQGELWNRKKNGDLFAEMLTITALKDGSNNTSHYVCLFSDITQSKQQQEKLELMAHYDVLTKLPNRVLFTDRFSQAIAHSRRAKNILAVCSLDLDCFKPVNDKLGHEVGDKLLVEVANRIKREIREEDTVSRQGGDEFALLLGNIFSLTQCEQILERLCRTIKQPYVIDEHTIDISASIGVTLYPEDEAELDQLLRHAAHAMYQVKLAGKNSFRLFNAEENQKLQDKHNAQSEIQNALNDNQFCLYYQPKVNMRTGKVIGAEALIRWNHPQRGILGPLEFLPVIEGVDLEVRIGNWVIREAIEQLTQWKKQGVELELSVNIAANHIVSPTFIDELRDAIESYPDIEARYLQLEVLESSALGDLEIISNIIGTCHESLGVGVALDDFGTGYSSLSHMRKLPVDVIKIDRSFVKDMLIDPEDYAIINGVIGLAKAFKRDVIAEGVESTEHGLALMKLGCDLAQGYAIARPMTANMMLKWLDTYQVNEAWIAGGSNVQYII